MPRAIVRTATSVKPGVLSSERTAKPRWGMVTRFAGGMPSPSPQRNERATNELRFEAESRACETSGSGTADSQIRDGFFRLVVVTYLLRQSDGPRMVLEKRLRRVSH